MNKSNVKTILFVWVFFFGFFGYFLIREALTSEEEEAFWRHPFEDPLEKADDHCEIGKKKKQTRLFWRLIYSYIFLSFIIVLISFIICFITHNTRILFHKAHLYKSIRFIFTCEKSLYSQ